MTALQFLLSLAHEKLGRVQKFGRVRVKPGKRKKKLQLKARKERGKSQSKCSEEDK